MTQITVISTGTRQRVVEILAVPDPSVRYAIAMDGGSAGHAGVMTCLGRDDNKGLGLDKDCHFDWSAVRHAMEKSCSQLSIPVVQCHRIQNQLSRVSRIS